MTKPPDPMATDFRALQVLMTVHELRSFTRAAEMLGVNQSAVSYTVEKLRAVFRDPLFVRQARQLLPTTRCDEIVREAARLTERFRQLATPPDFDPATVDQRFTIACNFYERVLIIPEVVRHLRREAPNIELEIIDASGTGYERLMRNEADLLIGPFDRADPFFFQRTLCDDTYVCVMDPTHPKAEAPLTLADFLALDHVVITYGGRYRSRYLVALERMGAALNVALRVPSPAALEELVTGSTLVATMPERLSKAAGKGLWVTPCPIETTVPIRLVWTDRHHRAALNIWVRNKIYAAATRTLAVA